MNEDNLTGHIYVLLFPNGKRYVGQTIQTLKKRMRRHWYPSKKEYLLPVHNAMRKYGKKGTTIEKVFTIKCTQEYLDLMEVRAIKHYNTLAPHGYNLTEGGHGGAMSEESKIKISIAKRGKVPWIKGRHHSEESRARISAARIGKHLSEESKAKVSAARKGKPLSEETIVKRTATRKENNLLMGRSAWNKGRCRSAIKLEKQLGTKSQQS